MTLACPERFDDRDAISWPLTTLCPNASFHRTVWAVRTRHKPRTRSFGDPRLREGGKSPASTHGPHTPSIDWFGIGRSPNHVAGLRGAWGVAGDVFGGRSRGCRIGIGAVAGRRHAREDNGYDGGGAVVGGRDGGRFRGRLRGPDFDKSLERRRERRSRRGADLVQRRRTAPRSGIVHGGGGDRGEVVAAGETGGFGLALMSDSLFVHTTSEGVPGLAAAEADVSRLRLGLEGSYELALDGGGRSPRRSSALHAAVRRASGG